MKIKLIILVLAAFLLVDWIGIGMYSSGSAVADLKLELESIYGSEYEGKNVENGTEDMRFEIEPKTCFLTNWNLRNAFALDYKYECRVIFTTHNKENSEIRTLIYQATDPMGSEERANLDLNSKIEKVELK